MSSRSVVVIGAGAVGSACAYHLAVAGCSPVLFDPRPIGSAASTCATGAGGFLAYELKTDEQFRWALEGHRMQQRLVPILEDLTGEDLQYQVRPSLRVAFDAEEEKTVKQQVALAQRFLPGARWLSAEEALEVEPRLNRSLVGAGLDPESSQLPAPRYSAAMVHAAERFGATRMTGYVKGVTTKNGRITGIVHDSGVLHADAVVFAMGPWTTLLAEWLGIDYPVRSLRGERILLRLPGQPLSVLIRSPRRGHIISMLNGMLSVGSTAGRDLDDRSKSVVNIPEEPTRYSEKPTERARDELLRRAIEVLPAVANAELVEQVAGIRPFSPDSFPLIGPVTGVEGAFVAAGHTHRGITLAAITGRVIADMVLTGTSRVPVPLETMSPDRFTVEAKAASKDVTGWLDGV